MHGHLIFDLDGTLVDSASIYVEVLNEMLADRGAVPHLDREAVRSLISIGGPAMIKGLLGNHCSDPDFEIAEFRERYAAKRTPADILYPGVRETLQILVDRELSLSICSARPQNLCEKTIADLGIDYYFKIVAGYRPGLPKKPNPAHLLAAIGGACASHEPVCMIGDSEIDHQAARAADVAFVLMRHGYADPAYDFGNIMIADGFDDLPRLVDQLMPLRLGQ